MVGYSRLMDGGLSKMHLRGSTIRHLHETEICVDNPVDRSIPDPVSHQHCLPVVQNV
jgi:hypothetical protein